MREFDKIKQAFLIAFRNSEKERIAEEKQNPKRKVKGKILPFYITYLS